MALLPSALTASPGLPGAGGADYPPTRAACAQAWADAVQAWAAAVSPPSTTVAAAAATLRTQLEAAFALPSAAAAMDAAFAAFAATVATGMAPTFVATPPPAPVGFAAVFAQPAPATRQEGVQRVATRLQAWMITGSATLSVPPGTPAIPWS